METGAGNGKEVGRRFEELRKVMDLVQSHERLGVCIDTCHIFAAGTEAFCYKIICVYLWAV